MARVRQFANDMGMSYNQAKNLVNKGRKLKDGGSSILENTMNKAKPVMASNGKYGKLTREETKMQKQNEEFKNTVEKSLSGKITPDEAAKVIRKIVTKRDGGAFGMLSVKAGIDKNPNATQADKIAGATMKNKPVKASKGRYQSQGSESRGCGAQVKGKKFKGIF